MFFFVFVVLFDVFVNWRGFSTSELDEWILFLLPLTLQPAVGFGLSNNTSPFFPIYHQLSPSSNSQHLKISFYFFSPSFPGSSSSSRPFQFLSEDLFGNPILLRWMNKCGSLAVWYWYGKMLIVRAHKYRVARRMCVFKKGPNTRAASVCKTIGAKNFEVVSGFLENLWTHFLFYFFIYFLLPNQE